MLTATTTTQTTTRVGWGLSQYQALARQLATARGGSYVLVAITANPADPPLVRSFEARDPLADAYGALADQPGNYAYLAAYEDGEIYDEAFFVATTQVTTTTSKTTSKTRWLWLAGAIGGGLAIATGIVLARRR